MYLAKVHYYRFASRKRPRLKGAARDKSYIVRIAAWSM